MPRIKDYLAEALETIKAEVTDEDIQAKVLAKVRPLLKKAENEAYELIEDKKLADDSVRDLKKSVTDQKNELSTLLDTKATMQEEIDKLNEKVADPEKDKELDGLREFKQNVLTEKRAKFINRFGEVAEHPNFEKVKGFFVIPGKDDKEALKWDEVDDAKMELNISKLEEYDGIGFFGETKSTDTNFPKGPGFPPVELEKPKTTGEAEARLEEYEKEHQ